MGLMVVGDSVGVVVGRVDGLLEGEEVAGFKDEGDVVDFVSVWEDEGEEVMGFPVGNAFGTLEGAEVGFPIGFEDGFGGGGGGAPFPPPPPPLFKFSL